MVILSRFSFARCTLAFQPLAFHCKDYIHNYRKKKCSLRHRRVPFQSLQMSCFVYGLSCFTLTLLCHHRFHYVISHFLIIPSLCLLTDEIINLAFLTGHFSFPFFGTFKNTAVVKCRAIAGLVYVC